MRSFIILLFLPLICSAAFGQVKNFEVPNPRARQAARCSFVATLEAFSDDSEKTKVFAKNLMKLSVKLGATQAQVGEWTAEFFSDLKAATLRSAPEEAPADPKFIGREINICTNFLDEQHGKSKAPPSE